MVCIIEFVYKNKVIATRTTDFPFTVVGKEEVHKRIRQKLITFPKNWDFYRLVRS